jgi:hypothetical protein
MCCSDVWLLAGVCCVWAFVMASCIKVLLLCYVSTIALPLGLEVEYQNPSRRDPNVVHSPFKNRSLLFPVVVCEAVRVLIIRAVYRMWKFVAVPRAERTLLSCRCRHSVHTSLQIPFFPALLSSSLFS